MALGQQGGAATLLFDGNAPGAFDIVADTAQVYWVDIYATKSVLNAPRAGVADGGAPVAVASGQRYLFGIAQDAKNIYWTTQGDYATHTSPDAGGFIPGTVMTAPKDGSTAPQKLADGQANPLYIAVDDTAAYWCNLANETVMKLRFGDTMPTVLFRTKWPFGIAVDATSVYVSSLGTDNADGSIVQMAKDGSRQPTTIATNLAFPTKVAVDATAVYWANVHGATVMKIVKP